jgi:transcriptional regulator GlxA family with amidase domain
MVGVFKRAPGRHSIVESVAKAQGKPRRARPFHLPAADGRAADPIADHNERFLARQLPRSSGGQTAPRPLESVYEYIEANLHRSLMVMELAMVADLSPTHFSRLFRQATGASPYRYVRRRRLERAERLILGTQLPFRDIARLVGCSDQSHLNRMMRAEIGLTPGQLRRAAR